MLCYCSLWIQVRQSERRLIKGDLKKEKGKDTNDNFTKQTKVFICGRRRRAMFQVCSRKRKGCVDNINCCCFTILHLTLTVCFRLLGSWGHVKCHPRLKRTIDLSFDNRLHFLPHVSSSEFFKASFHNNVIQYCQVDAFQEHFCTPYFYSLDRLGRGKMNNFCKTLNTWENIRGKRKKWK